MTRDVTPADPPIDNEWPDNDGSGKLPPEVPRHVKNGVAWHREGLCVACGGPKDDAKAYHCDGCYADIAESIADYDDD